MRKTYKVLIIVKTYPTLSKKYDELVCTAGILEDGSWVRIYPLPFRKLDYDQRYKKFQWIELSLIKNKSDPRPESYKVIDPDNIKLGHFINSKKNGWQERKAILHKKNPVYTNLTELIEKANSNKLSLATFKPKKIIDFTVEKVEREWNKEDLLHLKESLKQFSLFDGQNSENVENEFSRVDKLPYKFSYKFEDEAGKKSKLMIEDWEIGMLYWNCLRSSSGNEKLATEKVKVKYFNDFLKKDIHLFLGTTRRFHGWANNPFIIIGVFCPPIDNAPEQLSLF